MFRLCRRNIEFKRNIEYILEKQFFDRSFTHKIPPKTKFEKIAPYAALSIAAIGISLATNFYINSKYEVPFTGRIAFNAIPPNWERWLVKEKLIGFSAPFLPQDHPLSLIVEHIGTNLVKAAGAENLFDWKFSVVDSPVNNAFALPGKLTLYLMLL